MSGGTVVGTARRSALAGIDLLDDTPVRAGTRVLVRLDWNVPLHEGRVLDPGRIEATFPVLDRLVGCGALATVATHLGYPGGRPAEGLATAVLAPYVARYGSALRLLENLRFSAGEQANDPGFAVELARDHDVFVNDAFSCMHRPHASVVGVPALLP
ncbi:MAG: phosphoglycerate kinase, partial [Pseudonocardiaceae bacterium]